MDGQKNPMSEFLELCEQLEDEDRRMVCGLAELMATLIASERDPGDGGPS